MGFLAFDVIFRVVSPFTEFSTLRSHFNLRLLQLAIVFPSFRVSVASTSLAGRGGRYWPQFFIRFIVEIFFVFEPLEMGLFGDMEKCRPNGFFVRHTHKRTHREKAPSQLMAGS